MYIHLKVIHICSESYILYISALICWYATGGGTDTHDL